MFRINYHSSEWLAIKEVLEREREDAIKFLVNPGLPEAEYHQWRGRVALANKLLGLETTPKQVTE